MAKKKSQQNTDPKAQTLARIKRTEAYAEQVRKLFAATVNEILALNKTIPTLKEGEMFSFDGESLKKQKEVERLLRQLHSVATMAIQRGIRLEWAQANAECDRLVQSMFGKKVMTAQYTAYMQRNETAMAAFIARSERGLNLSDRVWRSCRQLRDEMEVAITVAIGDGTSAATMSRQVRQYLNDPDLMFRRFQYHEKEPVLDDDGNPVLDKHGKPKMQDKLDKNGKPIIRKKWKKRVIDPQTGKVTFIDFDRDSYIPVGAQRDGIKGSTGVYKSAAKNAMRVARTETNIAYRRADNERWKQMDFVLGQRVQLSRSHPKKDICDKLAGDYPPDFVFDGWHPQCFCFVTPILVDEDEIVKMNEAMMNGEEYRPRGKRITDYPDGFKEWVRENEDKLLDAHKAGKDPYFVRNNFNDVQNILNPKKALTPLEIAEQRHAARTPEQEEAIRLRWQERQAQREAERLAEEQERKRIAQINTTANNVLGVAKSRFADFGIDTSALDIAMQSGDTNLIKAETRALAKILSEKQKQIKQQAQSVIDKTALFKDFEGSTDVASLEALKKTGNLSAIQAQSQALETQVNDLRAKLRAMSSVIPDSEAQAQSFTVSELQAAQASIQRVFARWTWDWDSETALQNIKKNLTYEISWMETKGRKYATWEIARDAYARRLSTVENRLEMLKIKDDIAADLTLLSSARGVGKQLVADFNVMFADNDANLTALRNKAADIKAKSAQIQAQRARRAKKASASSTSTGTSSFTPKSDAETKKDFVAYCKSIGIKTISEANVNVDNGFVHLARYQMEELYDALRPETSAEHNQLWNHHGVKTRWGASGYVRTGNSFLINGDFRVSGVVGDIDAVAEARLRNATRKDRYGRTVTGALDDDIKTIKTLDKKIKSFSLPFPYRVTRYVEYPALSNIFGETISGSTKTEVLKSIKASKCQIQSDPAYLSASMNEKENVFTFYPVKLEIEIPPNMPVYLTNNYDESEVVFGRSTKLQFINASTNSSYVVIRCRMLY